MNSKNIVICIAVVLMLIIGSALAYFTDADSETNSFTVGNISLDLTEPSWNPEKGKNITPSQTIVKDPQITNDGANDAFVFISVEVPMATVKTANADGTANAAALKELFSYDVNDSWAMVKKTTETSSVTYVYAYVGADGNMKALKPGSTTQPAFDSVTFVNAIEGQLDNKTLTIDVSSMGIQANDLNTTNPAEVYEILTNQTE